MFKRYYFVIVCLMIALSSIHAQNIINVNTLSDKGAWCWFADPRAISYKNESNTINSTYIGYIDVHGNVKATQINHLANVTNEVLVRSCFQPDDHDNPTFLVLPDERIMIFYSRHTDEPCFYYRITRNPGDITDLGKEIRLTTSDNTTYPSPFILSDDPNHIYLCWRGIGWHPTIARLTMPNEEDEVTFDWGPYQILQSQNGRRGVRPYAKYTSNGKDRIYLTYTTTHPDNQSINYVYFNYIDINTFTLKDINGRKLETIGSGALHNVEATAKYKNNYPDAVVDNSDFRNWIWEVSVIEEQKPVIAMVRINENKDSHDYYHVRWTGKEWQKTFLSNAGGHFHQTPTTERCYSGGMALDKTNPNVIYGSVPVEGKHGKVYELKKFSVNDKGRLESVKQMTFDSPKNNIRPFMIANKNDKEQLTWMNGDYYYWIVGPRSPLGYPTTIRTNMDIPQSRIDLEKGILKQKSKGRNKGNIHIKKSKNFTICLPLLPDDKILNGELFKTNSFQFGITGGDYPKPYIEIREKIYESSNILGTSDSWKTKGNGTNGIWLIPLKLENFHLTISYEKGILRTYINGLLDQSIEVRGLSLSEVNLTGFNSLAEDLKVYNRALTQDEIKRISSQQK
jgi:hypothetical protein